MTCKIGEQTKTLTIENKALVGRALPNDDLPVEFDLTPYGAYYHGVSRHHALFTLHDGFLYLEDNGSTNGTRINGFQLTPQQKYRVRDGDEIEFGRLRMMVKFERSLS
jgi:pSer/pThr/pTyr-binding forkhead associated (FHA) protein